MKKITILIVLMLLSLVSFTQNLGQQQKEIENIIRPEIEARLKTLKAQQNQTQTNQNQTQPNQNQIQLRHNQTQTTQQQAIENYTNKMSIEGQIRMEQINNPDTYIDRGVTNRGSSAVFPDDRNYQQNQPRDLRTEPIHSESLTSKSLQMLREANRDVFSNERRATSIDSDPKVPLFEAPKLDVNPVGKANANNVLRYYDNSKPLTKDFLDNPNRLESLLKNQFEQVSGFDLDKIRSKQPESRTPEEIQVLADYEAYRVKEMEQMNKDIDNSKEKKEMDAAILALDSYGNDEEGWLSQTNYRKLDLESLSSDNFLDSHGSMLDVAEKIKECNDKDAETGFHADLYYNEVTNTYAISFRGTEKKINDLKTDGAIAADLIGDEAGFSVGIDQYELALEIGETINKIPQDERANLNIEAVGHSLGGGSASIVGLKTGVETKTFNAATVSDNFLKINGLSEKVNDGEVQNITAYHTTSDALTNIQNSAGKPAIGISVDIGNSQPDPKITIVEPGEAAFQLGNNIANSIEEHRMKNVVNQINNNNKTELDKSRAAQYQLQKELRSAEIRHNY